MVMNSISNVTMSGSSVMGGLHPSLFPQEWTLLIALLIIVMDL